MLQGVAQETKAYSQVELVEQALRQLTGISRSGWHDIPYDLRASFSRYMTKDAWTGVSDPLSLPEAALLIVRDAITKTGEFAPDESAA
jgi:hypothetical protein